MSFGISNIHFVQSYDNLINKMSNKNNSVNSGSIKWMNTKSYNHMKDCIESIKSQYDPVFVATDISKDSVNILDFDFTKFVHNFDEKMNEKSSQCLTDLLFYNLLTKDKIKYLKEQYNDIKISNNSSFIENIYLDGHFLSM